MTTSERIGRARLAPEQAFVWVWLPCASEPIVAGRLTDLGRQVSFTYGRSYWSRDDAIPLSLPELPLRRGEILPLVGAVAGAIEDSGPDTWGRRVIERCLGPVPIGPTTLGYLSEAGSDRIGALDIQPAADVYIPRVAAVASLEQLLDASRRVEDGRDLDESLRRALLHGSAAGGARPKVLIAGGPAGQLAKFPALYDLYPVMQSEFVAMTIGRRSGIDVTPVTLREVAARHVLLVERFDRTPAGGRRLILSAATLLRAPGQARSTYASYHRLADEIRSRFERPSDTMRELFSRITYNVLCGNTDDHSKNHAAFWDGSTLALTPAFDICPQHPVSAHEEQAMPYARDGERASVVARCIAHAGAYGLSTADATEIVDHQIDVIRDGWHPVCDQAGLTQAQRRSLWGSRFLSPESLTGHRRNPNIAPRPVPVTSPPAPPPIVDHPHPLDRI